MKGQERAQHREQLLTSAYCLSCRYRGGKGPGITMYNYGSPRVGNAAFARAYDESVPNSWRITNKLDVIPRVPRLMGYSHVGNSCSVLPDGTFEVNGELYIPPLLAQSSSFILTCPRESGFSQSSFNQAFQWN